MRDPEKRVESARAAYATGERTCSQAVMYAYASEVGLACPKRSPWWRGSAAAWVAGRRSAGR